MAGSGISISSGRGRAASSSVATSAPGSTMTSTTTYNTGGPPVVMLEDVQTYRHSQLQKILEVRQLASNVPFTSWYVAYDDCLHVIAHCVVGV